MCHREEEQVAGAKSDAVVTPERSTRSNVNGDGIRIGRWSSGACSFRKSGIGGARLLHPCTRSKPWGRFVAAGHPSHTGGQATAEQQRYSKNATPMKRVVVASCLSTECTCLHDCLQTLLLGGGDD